MFNSLKLAVNRHRTPGGFLLTGSFNVLLVPPLSDSLVGRPVIIRLHPLAQCELAGREPQFFEQMFAGASPLQETERLGRELARISALDLPISKSAG